MSVHNRNRKCRNFTRLPAAILAMMAASLSTVSTVSARTLSDRDSVHARTETAETSRKAVAVPAAGQVLGGFTSQGWPVVVEISKSGKTIALAGIGLDMGCASGLSFATRDGWSRLPISASGRVHAAVTVPPSAGSSLSLTGGTDSFSGKLDRRHSTFSGVWRLRVTFAMSNGSTDQCDSGRVTFSARL